MKKVISNLSTYIGINGKMILPLKPIDLTDEELNHPQIKKHMADGEIVFATDEDTVAADDAGPGGDAVPLEKMSFGDLKDLAKANGIELTTKDNSKEKVIAKIMAATSEEDNSDDDARAGGDDADGNTGNGEEGGYGEGDQA